MDKQKKKALFIVAPENFRDEEYFQPRVIMLGNGIKTVTTAKTRKEEATGTLGGKARIDIKFDKLKAQNYDAVVLIGGKGSKIYFEDAFVHKLLADFFKQNKVIAAICIAPSILANAGILKDKTATSFPSQKDNLITKGTKFSQKEVVTDDKIVTAQGPEVAAQFGQAVVDLLKA